MPSRSFSSASARSIAAVAMSNPVVSRLARLGFDVPRLGFGLRTALASCLALMLAWLMGLEYPQWSAMTVWAVSQPVRGMLMEKSLFRALGTVLGTIVGVLLVLIAGDNLLLMVISLALWIGLCAGVGNLLSGLVSYGTLLSGYSAAMVALLNTQHPPGQILVLGGDRLLTVMTGVGVALLIGLIFTPRNAQEQLAGRVRRTTADVLRAMAAVFAGHGSESRTETVHRLLGEIAATEQLFDTNAAGSLRNHRSTRALRALVQAQMAATCWIGTARQLPNDAVMADALAEAAASLERHASAEQLLMSLEKALAQCREQATATVLRQLLDSQREHMATEGEHAGLTSIRNRVVRHRDWVGARHASLRATGLLLLVGTVWIITGWSAGAYVMLGASVMITLFSTFETPAHIMGHIFVWQAIAALAALFCHWLLWPLATSEWQLIALLTPFILVIVPFFAHPKTANGAIDYVMVLLLLSQPALPLEQGFGDSVAIAAAVVSSPLLAYIAFRLAWPVDVRRRRRHLSGMMLDDVSHMAGNPLAPMQHQIRRARLYHRLLKLIQNASRSAEPLQPLASGGLAVLAVGDAIQQMHLLVQHQLPARLQRRAALALRRLQQLREKPQAAAASLQRLADRLQQHCHPSARDIGHAARAISVNIDFFQQ